MIKFIKENKKKILIGVLISTVVVVSIILIAVLTTKGKSKEPLTTTIITSTSANIITKKPYDPNALTEEEKSRINCFLEEESQFENLTQFKCESRNCLYSPSDYEKVPTCFFDNKNLGYAAVDPIIQNEPSYKLKLKSDKSPFLGVVQNLELKVEYLGESIINVKIVDGTKERYEVPYALNKPSKLIDISKSNALFEINEDSVTKIISFKIIRRSNNETIFDTSLSGFIYSDQFIQLTTKLSSENIYGFGENNHESLKHDLNFKSWGMFARDNAPEWGENKNLYGVQPVYMNLENSGKTHLVLLYNSNSMEYLFTPLPSLTFRTIGGVLDFYFVVNETPEMVLQNYHQLIGLPMFPPYWSFGFQLSRWGYKNLSEVQNVIERTKNINLPHDVQYIDIDYMIGYRILSVDPDAYQGLGEYMKKVREDGLKLVLIVDPGLVMEKNNTFYMNGIEKDIYVKWPENLAPYDKDALNPSQNDVISWCWPNWKISYPDYMSEKTQIWWEASLKEFTENITHGCDMDGIWIDMNEPSSFETNELKPWNWDFPDDQEKYPYFSLKCPTNKYDDPPYRTKNAFAYDSDQLLAKKARLSMKTLCMINKHTMNGKDYFHYDVHNLYAHSQAVASFDALKNIKKTRPFSLTRSNFVGTGKYAVHWLGDNESTWKSMKMSIIGSLEYNIFGIPMVGADICGFFREIQDAEMCTRWLQLGAFYPYTRSHNAKNVVDKDPASFKNKTLEDSTREVLKIRYTIIPYIYTLFYKIHKNGGSAMKPLFYEFPTDQKVLDIDTQFLLGNSLLVSPVLNPGETTVKAYMPKAKWYAFRTGEESKTSGDWEIIDAPLDFIPLHLRGGSIIPTQNPLNYRNTTWTRTNPFGLIVSLDENKKASGELFFDDGQSFEFENDKYFFANFTFEENKLNFKVDTNGIKEETNKLIFDEIKIYGFDQNIEQILADGNKIQKFDYDENLKVLKFNLNLGLDKINLIELITVV